ncbi:MAG: Nramp family divalent metal transporter [Pirellulales bacterium]
MKSSAPEVSGAILSAPIPRALVSRNPLEWLRVFGPGAVIASLTIGTGELIFSSRGGVIFGYAILFPFLLICLLKWTLAYSAARHMVIAGVHPFERWMDLPVGPRGWLTVLFFLLAVAFIPVWASFHASVLGDLLAALTGTKRYLGGATIHLWGCGLLVGVFVLSLAGGYSALEKIQIVIVACMLGAVITTLILFGPDWLELLRGFIVPQRFEYPAWLMSDSRPAARQIADRPVWVELSLYAGVIGGAGYDYLAYTSYLRDKGWGNAAPAALLGESEVGDMEVAPLQRPPLDDHTLRLWIRAPLID